MIHFIRPYCLILLVPALLYLAWVIYAYKQNNPWKSVCDPHLLPALLEFKPGAAKKFLNIVLFLLFTLSIIALSGPSWKKTKLPVYRDISSLLLVLDASNEMLATDLKPDRMTRAKFKIRDLINSAQNTQMGLVVFTQEAFVASPISRDANTLNALLDEINPIMMPVAGSDMAQGLTAGLAFLKQAGINKGNILLITASEPTADTWSVAKTLAQAGGHLTILAMLASDSGTQPTISKLQQLAQTGNGSFYLFSPDANDIQTIIYANNTYQALQDDKVDPAYLWQDAGPLLCLLLIPFALYVLREKVRHEKYH